MLPSCWPLPGVQQFEQLSSRGGRGDVVEFSSRVFGRPRTGVGAEGRTTVGRRRSQAGLRPGRTVQDSTIRRP